jgi:hypothetical protein
LGGTKRRKGMGLIDVWIWIYSWGGFGEEGG